MENWAEWVRKLYAEHEGRDPSEEEVTATAQRMVALAAQLPDEVVHAVQVQAEAVHQGKIGEIVALVHPGEQEQEAEVYALVSERGQEHVRLDAYNVPHATGRVNRDGTLVAKEVEMWHTKSGARVRGPSEAVFPKLKGWLLDGVQMTLSQLRVKKVTAALSRRKFITPASEAAWNQRRGKGLRWEGGWKLTSFYATPRDQVTWLKFQHRTLYTVGHDTKAADNECRACDGRESQLHLITCGVIRVEYWSRVIALLVEMGMDEPEDVTDFLITGQLNAEKTVPKEFSGVVFIAFRCLYAAITESRLDAVPLDLSAAYDRMVSMVVSRLNAVGEKWRSWVSRGEGKHKPHVIPLKHCQKCVMTHEPMGDYELHPALLAEKREIDQKKGGVTKGRPTRLRTDRCVAVARPTEEAVEEEEEGTTAETVGGETEEHEWRDMAGDAITWKEAQERGVHAQCTLASVRNLRRNPDYSVRRLSERCLGACYMEDIRCPDWPVLLEPMMRDGEVVKRVAVAEVGAEELPDFRAGVVLLAEHVVCFHRDSAGGFRVYDNDSAERLTGRPRRMQANEIVDEMSTGPLNAIIGILQEGSDLSRRLGPALTTLHHQRRPARSR